MTACGQLCHWAHSPLPVRHTVGYCKHYPRANEVAGVPSCTVRSTSLPGEFRVSPHSGGEPRELCAHTQFSVL